MRRASGGSAGVLLLMAALGCGGLGCGGGAIVLPGGGEKVCTLVACQDQFSATVTIDAATVPSGTHTIMVVADGAEMSCTFPFPEAASSGGAGAQCSTGLTVFVQPAAVCTTMQSAGVASEQCQPIDGKFTESIWVSGTPNVVHVQQTVEGAVILDQTVSPAYHTNEPNGPGCGPTCQQGGAEWTIPQ